jgi:hypothetical protein
MHLTPDCGATGNIRAPGVTNLSSPPQYELLCESPNPVHATGKCAYSLPDGGCEQGSSTFWYITTRTLAQPGVETAHFVSNHFPVKFSSSTLIVPGSLYGLCVIDGESRSAIQDDFASGHTVAPSGDAIHLKIVLPASYHRSLMTGDTLELFFESKPESS